MSIFEVALIGIAVVGGFALLFYLGNAQPDRRMDMNDIPGANAQHLTEEEIIIQQAFITYLKENGAFNSRVNLDLGNYNVNAGSTGVFKLSEKKWIVYEMAGWKEVKLERRFDNQVDAYKYFAKLRNLNWEMKK